MRMRLRRWSVGSRPIVRVRMNMMMHVLRVAVAMAARMRMVGMRMADGTHTVATIQSRSVLMQHVRTDAGREIRRGEETRDQAFS
ncbi:MAG: hypothetical protein KDA42_08355 [Planctomycetales bacterium]|nr:hypothetical protein [Planctomycetales bacterium]